MSKIKTERFYRSATVELVGRENDDRRIEVAFSSEAPVERSFGQEVLNHDPESIRQYSTYLRENKTIPGGALLELVPDKIKLRKTLNHEILK